MSAVLPVNWVHVNKYCQDTGSTPDEVRKLILSNNWKEGTQWTVAPDGAIHLSSDASTAKSERKFGDDFIPVIQSIGTIADRRVPLLKLPSGSGIYFLLLDRKIQYIGQSTGLMRRIGQHMYEGKIQFDAISWIECHEHSLTKFENAYLWLLLPPCNRRISGR